MNMHPLRLMLLLLPSISLLICTSLPTTCGCYFRDIPTKLDDFLEFQWKQGVEFLSHQPGYLDGKDILIYSHCLIYTISRIILVVYY